MAFIKDKDVFRAVNFAAKMIKDGRSAPLSISIASKYYEVNQSEVASNIGKRGAYVKNESWKN